MYDLVAYPITVGDAPKNLLSKITGAVAVTNRRAVRSGLHLVGYGLGQAYPDQMSANTAGVVDLIHYPSTIGDAPKVLVGSGFSGTLLSTTSVHAMFHMLCYGVGLLYPDADEAAVGVFSTSTNDYDMILSDEELTINLDGLTKCKGSFALFPWRAIVITILGKLLAFSETYGANAPFVPDELTSVLSQLQGDTPNTAAFPWMQLILTLLPLIQDWIKNR